MSAAEPSIVGTVPVDFQLLFTALPTAFLVMDRDLVIVETNPAYLELVGRRREEIVGRPVFEAFPPAPDALDEHGRILEAIAAGDAPINQCPPGGHEGILRLTRVTGHAVVPRRRRASSSPAEVRTSPWST